MSYRLYPVAVGVAAGVAVAALLSIVLWAGLALTGIIESLTGPVLLGVLTGVGSGGYVAGRLGDRGLFQGGMAGLGVAAAVVAISLIGGSPAPPSQLMLMFGFGLVLGMAGGALAIRGKES